jgi:hypothetical protein
MNDDAAQHCCSLRLWTRIRQELFRIGPTSAVHIVFVVWFSVWLFPRLSNKTLLLWLDRTLIATFQILSSSLFISRRTIRRFV